MTTDLSALVADIESLNTVGQNSIYRILKNKGQIIDMNCGHAYVDLKGLDKDTLNDIRSFVSYIKSWKSEEGTKNESEYIQEIEKRCTVQTAESKKRIMRDVPAPPETVSRTGTIGINRLKKVFAPSAQSAIPMQEVLKKEPV